MTQREREILNYIAQNPMISHQELAEKTGSSKSAVAVHISNLTKKGYLAGKGYVLRSPSYTVVVGGVNMDIGGVSNAPLVPGDSNPGRVRMSLGGVGRNIAHDLYAQRIAASCAELGIDISQARTVPGGATSTYLFLSGPDGDMALAVSDMDICEHITPAYLQRHRSLLDNAQVVVLDTNLPEASIHWLCENVKAPIFADPVSTAKAVKLSPVLGRIHTLKPNRLEAALLSGVEITDRASLERAARALLDTGLRRVFISLGEGGVYAADHSGALLQPCLPAHMVNATGAGDAFMAGLAWAYLEGNDLEHSARLAQGAAAIAVEGEETINPALGVRSLRERAGR